MTQQKAGYPLDYSKGPDHTAKDRLHDPIRVAFEATDLTVTRR